MISVLNDFVLPESLEKRLRHYASDPSKFTRPWILYGEPGTGKTSFALDYANEFGGDVSYIACNETGMGETVFSEISDRVKSNCLFPSDDKPFQRVLVIDEFHNLAKQGQDKFKTVIDALDRDVKMIFIANTDATKKGRSLSDVVSRPIVSRSVGLSFDIYDRDLESVVARSKTRYPFLSEVRIRALLPDHRQLAIQNEAAEWEAA